MNDPEKPVSGRDALAKRLAREAAITEAQAHDLITLIGYNWPSLMREARILAKKR